MLTQLQQLFSQLFNYTAAAVFFAPGRVNLIGEHTDYNGGHVFPCTLDIGTYAAVATRSDRKLRLYSASFARVGIIEVDLAKIAYRAEQDWANYPLGVIQLLTEAGYPLNNGLDIVFNGNLPNGAGLSSSASIEVLMATIIKDLSGYSALTGSQLAQICQRAENQFIGVSCGIMDQFAIANGVANHALLLNCNSLAYQAVPLQLGEYSLVIANSNKQRSLAESKYNERCQECNHALSQLQQELTIHSLGELDNQQFAAYSHLITDPVERQRARHAVSENQRTLAAVAALQKNDIHEFGQLMNQSHISLRDDYAVTGFELDSLVTAAWQQAGCIGARMTGAGFGGCTVNLVATSQVDAFIAAVQSTYQTVTNRSASFYLVKISNGAGRL